MKLTDLPVEIFDHICDFLPFCDLITLFQTNRGLWSYIRDPNDQLWYHICVKHLNMFHIGLKGTFRDIAIWVTAARGRTIKPRQVLHEYPGVYTRRSEIPRYEMEIRMKVVREWGGVWPFLTERTKRRERKVTLLEDQARAKNKREKALNFLLRQRGIPRMIESRRAQDFIKGHAKSVYGTVNTLVYLHYAHEHAYAYDQFDRCEKWRRYMAALRDYDQTSFSMIHQNVHPKPCGFCTCGKPFFSREVLENY